MQVPVFFEAVIFVDLRVQAPEALYVTFPALAFVFTPVNTAFNVVLFPRAKILALLAVVEPAVAVAPLIEFCSTTVQAMPFTLTQNVLDGNIPFDLNRKYPDFVTHNVAEAFPAESVVGLLALQVAELRTPLEVTLFFVVELPELDLGQYPFLSGSTHDFPSGSVILPPPPGQPMGS